MVLKRLLLHPSTTSKQSKGSSFKTKHPTPLITSNLILRICFIGYFKEIYFRGKYFSCTSTTYEQERICHSRLIFVQTKNLAIHFLSISFSCRIELPTRGKIISSHEYFILYHFSKFCIFNSLFDPPMIRIRDHAYFMPPNGNLLKIATC